MNFLSPWSLGVLNWIRCDSLSKWASESIIFQLIYLNFQLIHSPSRRRFSIFLRESSVSLQILWPRFQLSTFENIKKLSGLIFFRWNTKKLESSNTQRTGKRSLNYYIRKSMFRCVWSISHRRWRIRNIIDIH
jgi:hypothetical protein